LSENAANGAVLMPSDCHIASTPVWHANCVSHVAAERDQWEVENMAIDPVCGMQVDEKTAAKTTHAGKTYYFCSEECKNKFCAKPSQYTGEEAASRS
jgi:Cu+-exporting ATPase